MVESCPEDFSKDPFVISQNDNMVSINSAISADTAGPRRFSRVGGQVDFVRGANRSKGGSPTSIQSGSSCVGGPD
ncbi:MAG: hypothetical protein HY912_02760 [Desulfomonile tiedjei]|uniref:Acetyl-CoA hydrolase/transferase C-terminal domain-containing protein n=1 Tax=Desulfomonile tiedjei TaxID=2358 RepID=A0A9D6V3A5_9BACT|nr:hypothetical protein [Desulfomonile tiedjei]